MTAYTIVLRQRQPLATLLLLLLVCHQASLTHSLSITPSKIRAISLDVTGTLLATREPVIKSYHDAAVWAQLSAPPTQAELKHGFKVAFKERCIESPCFGGVEGVSGREWWRTTVERVLFYAKNTNTAYYSAQDDDDDDDDDEVFRYTDEEFDRYFRRVYQHFGSPNGYMILDDAQLLLDSIQAQNNNNEQQQNQNNHEENNTKQQQRIKQQKILLGITSNTPTRHMESVLPMLNNLHDRFAWFTCSQDVKSEKPSRDIFQSSYNSAKFWIPDLQKEEVLHIGDSYACDYCGAKRFGFQAVLLDRSDNPNVNAYQDWLEGPDYEGKSLEDVDANTVTSLEEVAKLFAR